MYHITYISIHALLAESDHDKDVNPDGEPKFLSTLSLRRATKSIKVTAISITISIHALLAESDRCPRRRKLKKAYFYPRSPCGERRIMQRNRRHILLISIHALLAESDQKWPKHQTQTQHFYPRSPCGERHIIAGSGNGAIRISIHALLAESDY